MTIQTNTISPIDCGQVNHITTAEFSSGLKKSFYLAYSNWNLEGYVIVVIHGEPYPTVYAATLFHHASYFTSYREALKEEIDFLTRAGNPHYPRQTAAESLACALATAATPTGTFYGLDGDPATEETYQKIHEKLFKDHLANITADAELMQKLDKIDADTAARLAAK